jgi:NAD(P)-dependent dehydrogenase (short-subunit alcohol dehydrogenase family)
VPEGAYGNSKAAQIMFTQYLNEKCKDEDECYVTVNALHPGVVKTDLYVHAEWITVSIYKKQD